MSAGYDAEVAELFRDLRVASSLTETDLAARIATPVEVVQALEQGAIYALPPWPETCRVVNAYGSLLNLDTRPLLRRIYAQLEAGIVELGPKSVPDVPVMAPQAPPGDFSLDTGADPAVPPASAPGAPVWPNGQHAAPPLQPPAPQEIPPSMHPPEAMPQAAPPPQAQWPQGAPQFPPGDPAPMAPQTPAAPPAPGWPNDPHAALPSMAPQVPGGAGLQPPPPTQDAGFQAHDASFQAHDASFPGQDASYGDDTDFGEDASFGEAAEEEAESKRPALLKWGIGALVAAVVLLGLWLALSGTASDMGSSSGFNASDPVLDPDDPRSRKADRLPSKF